MNDNWILKPVISLTELPAPTVDHFINENKLWNSERLHECLIEMNVVDISSVPIGILEEEDSLY